MSDVPEQPKKKKRGRPISSERLRYHVVHNDAPESIKLDRLVDILDIPQAYAFGIVSWLWCATGKQFDDGRMTGRDLRIVLRKVVPKLDSNRVVSALIEAGWLDELGPNSDRFEVHEWLETQPDVYGRRAKWRKRKTKQRSKAHGIVTRDNSGTIGGTNGGQVRDVPHLSRPREEKRREEKRKINKPPPPASSALGREAANAKETAGVAVGKNFRVVPFEGSARATQFVLEFNAQKRGPTPEELTPEIDAEFSKLLAFVEERIGEDDPGVEAGLIADFLADETMRSKRLETLMLPTVWPDRVVAVLARREKWLEKQNRRRL